MFINEQNAQVCDATKVSLSEGLLWRNTKAGNIKKPFQINGMALLITYYLKLTTYLAASSFSASSPPSNLARISASAPKSPKVAFSTFA